MLKNFAVVSVLVAYFVADVVILVVKGTRVGTGTYQVGIRLEK